MHKKHMLFYCALGFLILVVLYKIFSIKGFFKSSSGNKALGVGQGTDPRLPKSDNNQNPVYTPKLRRRLGITGF